MAGRFKHSYAEDLLASVQQAAFPFVHHYSGGTDEDTLDGKQQVLAMALTQRITNQLAEQVLTDLGDVVPVNRTERAQFIVEAQAKAKLTFQKVLNDNNMEAQDREPWVLLAKLFMTTLDGLVETAIVAASHADGARIMSTTASLRDPVISNLEPTTKLLADVMEKLTDHVTTKPKGEVSKHLADALRWKKALHEEMELFYDANGLLKTRVELYEVLKADVNFCSTGNLSQFAFLVRQSLSLAPYVRNNDNLAQCESEIVVQASMLQLAVNCDPDCGYQDMTEEQNQLDEDAATLVLGRLSTQHRQRFESAVAAGTATRTMTNAYAYLFDLLRDNKISLVFELVEMRVMKQDISCFPLHKHEKEICENLSDRGESVARWMVSVYQLRRMTIKPENRCSVETQGLVQKN